MFLPKKTIPGGIEEIFNCFTFSHRGKKRCSRFCCNLTFHRKYLESCRKISFYYSKNLCMQNLPIFKVSFVDIVLLQSYLQIYFFTIANTYLCKTDTLTMLEKHIPSRKYKIWHELRQI